MDAQEVLRRLGSTPDGLSSAEARRRLTEPGASDLTSRPASRLRVLGRQVTSPLLWILIFAATVSAATAEWSDAIIVIVIILATVGVGYWREAGAERALEALQTRVRIRAAVRRDGQTQPIARDEVVPGDVILLSAGSLVPADARVLDATDCFVSEAVLTGESFPVEKSSAPVAADAPLTQRTDCVFLGTNVRSGTARCVAVATGRRTALGAIAKELARRAPETDFDRGIRRFGYLLTSAMLIIVLLVFAAHMLRGRPPMETLLFSIALAVGLSPELLPAILSINLARGAQLMAHRGVLVRRLHAIENLGSMDVLCTDKTGTLTEGVVRLEAAYDADGAISGDVLERCAYNAALETGLANPLDDAILEARAPDLSAVRKLAEIPFDFARKRVSVVVERGGQIELITKGAFDTVIDVCTRTADGRDLDAARRTQIEDRYRAWSAEGIRVLAVAVRTLPGQAAYTRADETGLTFLGFVTFADRPKEGASRALRDLAALGVSIKLVTGVSSGFDEDTVAKRFNV